MINQKTLKRYIISTLQQNQEFIDLCEDLLKDQLSYYSSSRVDKATEVLPFMTVFSGESEEDNISGEPYNAYWTIPVAIGIESTDKHQNIEQPIDVDGATIWETPDIVSDIATKAVEVLKADAASCGIGGEDIHLVRVNSMVTQVGDADDTQASMLLTFGRVNTI